MKVIRNRCINMIGIKDFEVMNKQEIEFDSCIIGKMDMVTVEFEEKVTIRNCVIHELVWNYTWFKGGLDFSGNVILSDIFYEAGGYNCKPLIFDGNVFKGFFGFFDCKFDELLVMSRNILEKDSDLLFDDTAQVNNEFRKGLVLEHNIGSFDKWLDKKLD